MSLKRIGAWLLGIVVALVVLAWQFPARGLLLFLPNEAISSPQHRVHSVEGSLWGGAATVSIAAIPSVQRVAWNCWPSLSKLALDCSLVGSLTGTVVARPLASKVDLSQIAFRSALQFAPNPSVNATSESLAVKIDSGSLSRARMALKGSAVAADFAVTSPALNPNRATLGEVFIDCAPDSTQHATVCTIKNRGAATKLDGALSITSARASGTIEVATPGSPPMKFGF